MKQAPALVLIALRGRGAFAFEIDVVDESEGALGSGGEEVVMVADPVGIGARGGEHFGQGRAGADHDELGLLTNGGGEEAAQFLLAGTGAISEEGGAGVPRAGATQPVWRGDALAVEVGDETGEAFFEAAAAAFGIPDEVADAEGGEVLALIPTGQAIDGARALILPDALANAVDLRG